MPSEAMALSSAAGRARSSRALHVILWLVQLLLAAVFLLVGYTHALSPIAEAAARAAWVTSLPLALLRFIGAVEIAGALGLILPAATRVRPGLTPLAAAGLVTVMVLAIPFHLSRGETDAIVINLVLASLAAFVAWGRMRKARIPARRRASPST